VRLSHILLNTVLLCVTRSAARNGRYTVAAITQFRVYSRIPFLPILLCFLIFLKDLVVLS